jgi:nitrous oxidase accessory protein
MKGSTRGDRGMPGRAMLGVFLAGLLLLAAVAIRDWQSRRGGPDARPVAQSQQWPAIQPLIDAAAEGSVVTPPPGRYRGPALITKPMTLDGADEVTIDGGGVGTVVVVKTNGATVRNLRITNSGEQHNDLDSGLRIEGNFNVVKDVVITESLFGIDLQEASGNVVRRNRISSKGDADLGVKGDAIRLWYARDNRIEENVIADSRDLVVWYSSGNTFARNSVSRSRYGLHFMYAKNNLVEDNQFDANAVGIYLMYDEGDVIRRNRVFQALGAAGVGIGFKEASNIDIEDNQILYNAVGMAFDITPFEPDSTVRVQRNRIAFNDIGVSFLSDRPGNIFHDNVFQSNTQHVAMRLFEQATKAEWQGNYWDDYEGFDRNRDGTGDTPHVLRSYADRLWMDVPSAALFKGSPGLTVLDFIERLAPFTEPLLLLKDDEPRMRANFTSKPRPQRPKPAPQAASPGAEADRREPKDEHATDSRIDPFGLYKK